MTIRKQGMQVDQLTPSLVFVGNMSDGIMPVMFFVAPNTFAPAQPLYWANKLKTLLGGIANAR